MCELCKISLSASEKVAHWTLSDNRREIYPVKLWEAQSRPVTGSRISMERVALLAAPIKCMNNKVSEKTQSHSPRMRILGPDSIPPKDWMNKAHPLVGSVLTHTVRIEIDGRVVPVTAILDTGGEVTMVRDSVISPDMWKDAWEVKDGLIAGVGTATFDKLLPIKLAMGRTVTQAVWTTILPMPHEQWPFSNADVIVDNMTLQVMLSRIVFSDLHLSLIHI